MRRFTLCITSFALVLSLVVVTAVPAFAVEGEYLASSDNFQSGWYHYSNTGVTNGIATFGSVECLTRDLSIPAEGSQTRAVGYFTVSPTEAKRVYKLVFGVRGFRDTGLANTKGVSLSIKYIDNQTNDSIELFSYSSSKFWGDLNQHIEKVITLPESFGSTGKIFYECISESATTPVRLCIYGLTITDDTTKDLDASLDKFGDRIDSIINPSEPYNSFDDGSFEGSANELKDAESALPTVDYNAFQDLANSIDLSEYSNTFAAINNLFIRFVDTVGITPLIFFALFFGICIFILGRKLSGG